MEVFRRLGEHIKARWGKASYDLAAFTELAVAGLSEIPPFGVTLEELFGWVQTTREWIGQIESPFGNPITVYRDERFYIDVLTWVDGTTSVHEHAFEGAFGVLRGSSLHCEHRFVEERRLSERIRLGRTELVSAELLREGDVRPIYPGPRSAHALFHLARPSLSVVVRTIKNPDAGIQYEYLRSGVAFDPFFEDLEARRIVRTLSIMHQIDHPELVERARRVLAERDAFTRFVVLRELWTSMKLEPYRELLHGVPGLPPEIVAAMDRAAEAYRRERNITSRRRMIRRDDHRFFLALLLNLDTRQQIFSMITAAFPGEAPVDLVCRWVAELSTERAPAEMPGEPNLIGIELDEPMKHVLRLLLQGLDDRAVLAALAEEYDGVAESEGDVHDLCAAFRKSLLFRPLLAEPAARRA